MIRTNVMRLLEAEGIAFTAREFAVDAEDQSGACAARKLGIPPEQLFKTLVLLGERKGVFVCCIPCQEAVDLRKAARAAGDKKAELLPMKDMLAATGYIRGGCSPIGMKRKYAVFIDETACLFDWIAISAGARGAMVTINPEALRVYTGAAYADLTIGQPG